MEKTDFNQIYDGLISGSEKLALVGLGYVGMPIAVEFAKHIQVIGYDINEQRVNEYRNGIDATTKWGRRSRRRLLILQLTPSDSERLNLSL